MGFTDNFRKFKQRIIGMGDSIFDMTEEATKNALVMPFFSMLGYDVFDPQEFVPEYTCDVGTKKGEKIDYAIMRDNEPIMLIEAKRCGMKLQKQQQGQLFRYFSVNRSRIAILTNGLQYNIYSDINAPNVMDDEPFLSFNIIEDDETVFIQSLEKFTSDNFNVKEILSKAVYMKYSTLVERIFLKDLEKPSDELVKYFLMRPEIKTGGRITSHIINQYRDVTAQTLRKVMGITLQMTTEINVVSDETSDDLCDSSISKQIENALGTSLNVSNIYGGLKNAECAYNNKKYRIRWNENKPRYNVTEYYDNTYKLYFCNSIDDVVKIIKP